MKTDKSWIDRKKSEMSEHIVEVDGLAVYCQWLNRASHTDERNKYIETELK